MGKLVQDNFSPEIKKFINDYQDIAKEYKNRFKESLNLEPYNSINNFPLKECKYRVSIVISTWNSGNTLLYTLKSIENTYLCHNFNNKLEVIVVDDGSTDTTEDFILKEDFSFKLMYIKQYHLGKAQGINMGCKYASGDLIIFCDSDIILFPFTIDEIVKRQQEYLDSTIFFGFREDIENIPPIRDLKKFIYKKEPCFWLDNRFITDFRGSWTYNMMSETNMLQKMSSMKNLWVSNNKISMYDSWQLYRMVYGFLFAVSKKNFEKIGGFAEFLVGWGCDDTTFVSLCIENGVKIIPVPSATCCHIKHPIRMKSQWEDGKKNEDRMNKYLSNSTRINYLNQDFNKRILNKIIKYPNKKVSKQIKKYQIHFKNSILEARYYYYLGNFAKAVNLYLPNSKKLNLDDLENLYDSIIRTNSKDLLTKIDNSNKNKCYFYYLANYYFNEIYENISIKNGSYHINYLFNIDLKEHLKRANAYYKQEQWYLALKDFFGCALISLKYLKKCNECIKKIKRL